jgi:hypothetical protein
MVAAVCENYVHLQHCTLILNEVIYLVRAKKDLSTSNSYIKILDITKQILKSLLLTRLHEFSFVYEMLPRPMLYGSEV